MCHTHTHTAHNCLFCDALQRCTVAALILHELLTPNSDEQRQRRDTKNNRPTHQGYGKGEYLSIVFCLMYSERWSLSSLRVWRMSDSFRAPSHWAEASRMAVPLAWSECQTLDAAPGLES